MLCIVWDRHSNAFHACSWNKRNAVSGEVLTLLLCPTGQCNSLKAFASCWTSGTPSWTFLVLLGKFTTTLHRKLQSTQTHTV